MRKAVPIGYEDMQEIIDKNMYYVDKTLMLKELIDTAGKVNLFTRPRRFGKTLNLSMIKRFFEKEIDMDGNVIDHAYLFKNLKIASQDEKYMTYQGQYPIISLSLKSAKQPNFEMAYKSCIDEVEMEFERHKYVLESDRLSDKEKEKFISIWEGKAENIEYAKSLKTLSDSLYKYHQKKVIILLDEYDVPLENAYFSGFYDEMIVFIRSLFESALKTNASLEFAVITGCLRISKESIFTGLNNLSNFSVLEERYADSFGFTENEVMDILSTYKLEDRIQEVKRWYDGYKFGSKDIYNPWSILNYVDQARDNVNAFPKAYWSNTSSNSIIKELIEDADFKTRKEIEDLIAGNVIEKPIHEEITYGDIHESQDNLWNFLFFTGYLKMNTRRSDERKQYLEMSIPNEEVISIYEDSVLKWFDKKIGKLDMTVLFQALEQGDCKAISTFLSDQLLDTISFFDYKEDYYHGFLTGLLQTSQKYYIYSNRESGLGRSDLIMKTQSLRGRAFILEFKVADSFQTMERVCEEALEQIEKKKYEADLRKEGYSDIKKYGFSFYHKECLVKSGNSRVY